MPRPHHQDNIDPDVAAILDDLPPARLPDVLVQEGWGQQGMGSIGRSPQQPSTVSQPVYNERCAQCERPITRNHRNLWADHAGKIKCPNDLGRGDDLWSWHCTADEASAMRQSAAKVAEAVRKAGPCGAWRLSRSHTHLCEHAVDHFGFHECHECRYLWR